MKDVYYAAQSKTFTNALKFWEHVIDSKEPFHFYLYDEQFSAADWMTEPTQSISYLSGIRAKQIREKYDHVRIWYSAGRDSHHILRTFLENGHRVDELMIMDWSIMARFETDAKIAYETAIETFKEFNLPLPMITVMKPGEKEFNQYFKKDWFLQYGAYGCNYNFNLNHYPSIVESDSGLGLRKNHCEVLGFEKSKIHMDTRGHFYFQMNDKNFNQGLGNQDNIEWFYLSGDLPELAIKQCHLILNYVEDNLWVNSSNIESFQQNQKDYDTFATILDRGPAITTQTGGGVNKTFGFNPQLYQECFNLSKTFHWDARANYSDFVSHVDWLAYYRSNSFYQEHMKSFAGVPTKQYYIT